MSYNWQEKDWPEFLYDLSGAEEALLTFAERMGRQTALTVSMNQAGGDERQDMYILDRGIEGDAGFTGSREQGPVRSLWGGRSRGYNANL